MIRRTPGSAMRIPLPPAGAPGASSSSSWRSTRSPMRSTSSGVSSRCWRAASIIRCAMPAARAHELRRAGDRHRVAAQRDARPRDARELHEVAVVDARQRERVGAFGREALRSPRRRSRLDARDGDVQLLQILWRHRRRSALEQRARRRRLRETRSRRAATPRARAASRSGRTRTRCRRAAARQRAVPRGGSRTARPPWRRRCRAAKRPWPGGEDRSRECSRRPTRFR